MTRHSQRRAGAGGGQRVEGAPQVLGSAVDDDDDGDVDGPAVRPGIAPVPAPGDAPLKPRAPGTDGAGLCRRVKSRRRKSRQTIQVASKMIRRFIFEIPTRRSAKTMPISFTRKPRRQQRNVISIWKE